MTGDVEQATMEWLRERQDAETHLKAYLDRASELKARLAQLEAGGPEAPCPTCGRPLADHLGEVRVQLREEWESVVQDGRWWKRRRAQLEDKPEHLRALEAAAERLEAARTRLRRRAPRCCGRPVGSRSGSPAVACCGFARPRTRWKHRRLGRGSSTAARRPHAIGRRWRWPAGWRPRA